jgi:CSLREA domain-containing protein
MGRRNLFCILSFLSLVLITLIVAATIDTQAMASGAGVIAVNSFFDDNIDNGNCTLREAIIAANTDTARDNCEAGNGPDTISLPAGIYTLTITGVGDDANVGGDLDITSDLTIQGAQWDTTIIDGNGTVTSDRVFHVDPGGSGIEVNISDLTIRNGHVYSSGGGGIHNQGILTLDSIAVVDNNVTGEVGSGIHNEGTLILTDSLLDNNFSDNDYRSGLNNTGVLTATNSTISYHNGHGIHSSYDDATPPRVTLINCYLLWNDDAGIDGFNSELTLIGGVIGWNYGEGIRAFGSNINLANVSVISNGDTGVSATMSSGKLVNTEISDNSTDGSGGGLYYWGLNGQTITLKNVTVSNNEASESGGGIMSDSGPSSNMIINNVTITGNTAVSGGGIYNNSNTTLSNSILAFNSSDNCAGDNAVTSNGYNIDSGTSCNFSNAGDMVGKDPQLGPLQDNGGETYTHALLPGSPAIDKGSPGPGSTCETTDQRGIIRPQGSECDIGAYEFLFSLIYLPIIIK